MTKTLKNLRLFAETSSSQIQALLLCQLCRLADASNAPCLAGFFSVMTCVLSQHLLLLCCGTQALELPSNKLLMNCCGSAIKVCWQSQSVSARFLMPMPIADNSMPHSMVYLFWFFHFVATEFSLVIFLQLTIYLLLSIIVSAASFLVEQYDEQ